MEAPPCVALVVHDRASAGGSMEAGSMEAGGEGSLPSFIHERRYKMHLWREPIMHGANKTFAIGGGFRLTQAATVGLATLIACCAPSSFAQGPPQQTFPSAEAE